MEDQHRHLYQRGEDYAGHCVECGPQYSTFNRDNICRRSHAFCDFCYEHVYRLTGCEICRKTAGSPDWTMFHFAPEYNRNACKCKPLGCRFVSKDPIVLKRHNQGCKLRSLSCEVHMFGLGPCYWHGGFSQVVAHFEKIHPEHYNKVINNTLVIAKFNLKKEQISIHLIKHEDELFYYKHKLDLRRQKFYVAVQMIGLEEIANKYFYQYLVIAGDRTMNMQEMCHSDGMEDTHIFQAEKCAVIPVKTLRNYVIDDTLRFEFNITRVMS